LSITSLERPTTTARDGLGSGGTPPVAGKKPGASDRLYRIVWRWHFYAGMIVAPVLIVVAATGALYIFKDELEAVLYPGVTYVAPAAERVSYERQLAAAQATFPTPVRIGLMQVFADPRRATSIAMFGNKFEYAYVDPYRGRYLGAIEQGGFFDIVLTLHRQLFVGTTGRIIVELATCWTIVLAATGMYLWWPRKWNQVWGVWLPRLRRKPYVVLRDLHSVGGIYVAIIAIVISLTGLIYTYTWGRGFQYASQKTGAYDIFSKPMLCKSPPSAKDLPIDRFIEIGHEKMPGETLTVWFPRAPNGVYMVFGSSDYGPSVHEMLFIDRATGEILDDRQLSQAKPLFGLEKWNYPLHVGSVLGLTSKILWLVTCLILMTSPVTGVWMWWERRPTGRLGLPRRIDARRPRWLVATIMATSLLLPTLGVSVVVVLVFDLLVSRLRRAWA
jgi:uncharacterized iron-regulated membrane protein